MLDPKRTDAPSPEDVWAQYTRGNVAWDRLLALNDAIEIVAHAIPKHRGLPDAKAKRDELDQRLADLRKVSAEEFQKGLELFEEDLELAETRLMRVDADLLIPDLRKTFQTREFRDEEVARYVSVLVRHVAEAPERRDKVDFLATRLFAKRLENGKMEMRPYADVHAALRVLVPDSILEQEAHGEAVAYFRDAIRRLYGYGSIDEMFDSGFYTDVRGYKLSLQDELMDPDVLYSAAELNTAIHNWMHEFARMEGRDASEIRERVAQVNKEVMQVFDPEDHIEEVRHTQFNRIRMEAEQDADKRPKKKKKKKKKGQQPGSVGRVVVQAIVVVIVLAGGIGATYLIGGDHHRGGVQAAT